MTEKEFEEKINDRNYRLDQMVKEARFIKRYDKIHIVSSDTLIYKINDFQKCKLFIKEAAKKGIIYKDSTKWFNGDFYIVSWESDYSQIWCSSPIDSIPKEILGDCSVQTMEKPRTINYIACNKDK